MDNVKPIKPIKVPKLLIIGVDGGDYQSFLENKPSPEFNCNLMYSFKHPYMVTGAAWSSLYSGILPQNHKVTHTWGVSVPAEGRKNLIESGITTFWQHLNRHGKTVELVNLPLTYPPQALNRFMISGFPVFDHLDPATKITYPDTVRLPDEYMKYLDVVFSETKNLEVTNESAIAWIKILVEEYQSKSTEQCIELLLKYARLKLDALKLNHSNDADLVMVCYMAIDRACHVGLLNSPASVTYLYKEMNKLIMDTIKAVPADNVWVVSDHGSAGIEHRISSVFLHTGKDMRKDCDGKLTLDIIDIAPAIYYLFDLPLPVLIDGLVPYQVFEKSRVEVDQLKLKTALSSLGYI